ncbi:hypothetical protein ACJX0J_028797, partial [Zea mays]
MTVAAPSQLAHRTLSSAHRTVRCPLPTVGAGHASPADCATDRCAGGRWLTGQSGAPPDSPVNYSHTPPIFPQSGLMSHEGEPKAKRHRIESLESELARYDWIKGESLQSLFDRLMVLVNKIRVLGSE